jgi:large subunit ribosomal protein L7A
VENHIYDIILPGNEQGPTALFFGSGAVRIFSENVDKAGLGCYDIQVAACSRVECALFKARFSGKERRLTLMEMLRSAAKRVVGTKQVTRALKAGTVARAYVANDADTFIFQQVVRAAEEARVPCVRVNTMKELGMISGVEVPAAAAAVIK